MNGGEMCWIETAESLGGRKLAARWLRLGELSDRFRRAHSVEGARHQLRSTCAIDVVSGLRFEKFCVSEDDSKLIVQAVEEHPQVGVHSRTMSWTARLRPACECTVR